VNYPQKITTVATEAVGDGMGVFDRERAQSFVLNATSALVFQHCDGKTSPQQLTELLRRKLNLPLAEADQVTRLALDELETAGLLMPSVALMPPPTAPVSRRSALTAFAAAGLSLLLLPMVSAVARATGGGDDHGGGNHGDDDHGDHGGGDHGDHDHGGHTVIPLLECIDNNGNGTYTAHFGYLNQSSRNITLPIGHKNEFKPGQPDRGQPTVFLPGEHLDVFSVVFNGNPITWALQADGDHCNQVTASSTSEGCATTDIPTTNTPSPN